jgi:Tfp pilus assembly protein PilN
MARSNSKQLKVHKVSKYKQANSKVPFLVWVIVGVLAVVVILIIVFNIQNPHAKLAKKYNALETPANLVKENHIDVVTYDQLKKHIDSGNAVILLVGGSWQSSTVSSLQVYEASLDEKHLFNNIELDKWEHTINEKVKSILYLETSDLDAYKEAIHQLKDDYQVPFDFSATGPGYNNNPQLITFYDHTYVDAEFKHSGNVALRETYISLYNIVPEGYKPVTVIFPTWAIATIVIVVVVLAGAAAITIIVLKKKKQNK